MEGFKYEMKKVWPPYTMFSPLCLPTHKKLAPPLVDTLYCCISGLLKIFLDFIFFHFRFFLLFSVLVISFLFPDLSHNRLFPEFLRAVESTVRP